MLHSRNVVWSSRRALLMGVLLCGWGWFAPAQDELPSASLPERMQMDAYLALFRGDEARDEERPEQAALAYREAAEAYHALQTTYPDYQPAMVKYRLTHADRELAAIEPKQPDPSELPPVEVDGDDFEREQINALRTENRYLRQKVLGLEDEVEEGEGPSPEHVEELSRLSQRGQELSMTVSMLRKQLDSANVDRTALRAAQQEARELKTVVAKQRSQLVDQRKRSEEVGSLRERVTELSGRNRQLELAIKGAEQEANSIRRLEEQLRVLNSKTQLLMEDRNRLAGDVTSMTAREETLQGHRQRLEASQSQAEKALAASLKEAQAFMERSGGLEEMVAQAQSALEQVRNELAVAKESQAESQAELVDVEAELAALRKTHIATEAQSAELRQEALEGRNLKTELAEIEAAHQAALASMRQAEAEAMAARSSEAERELAILMKGHAATLEEEVRLREELLARERERGEGAASDLMAKHAADLDGLKSEMQALKADLKLTLTLESPVPARLDEEPVLAEEGVDALELGAEEGVPAAQLAVEEAELRAMMLQEELEASRNAVGDAWAERDALTAKLADTDELRRTIAVLTEERFELRQQLEAATEGAAEDTREALVELQQEHTKLKQEWEVREAEMIDEEKELIRLRRTAGAD